MNDKAVEFKCRVESTGSGQSPVSNTREHDNELADSVKDWKLLGQLSYYYLLKKTFLHGVSRVPY